MQMMSFEVTSEIGYRIIVRIDFRGMCWIEIVHIPRRK